MKLAALLPGASKGLQPIKYGPLLYALANELGQVEIWDVEPSRFDRLLIAARTFSPDKARFRARFYASPLAFKARSRSVGRLSAHPSQVDAILQFGSTCDAGGAAKRWPLVIYTDYTIALTRELGSAFRLGLSEAQIEASVQLERAALSRADAICTRSHLVAEALHAIMDVPQDRLLVVGAGPNISPQGERATPPRLLFFGTEFYRKGGDLVLDAFRILRRDIDWLEMDIVGSTPPGGLPPGVSWHSGISPTQVARLLGGATILLAPSRFETWGDVIVEAMAGGVVPVVADLPPMTEIVTDGTDGLVAPRENAAALAKTVQRLLHDRPMLARLSQGARDRVTRDLNQQAVAAKIAAVLRRVVSARA